MFRRGVQEIAKTLINSQQRTAGGAVLQNPFQQSVVRGASGGIVGLTQEQQIQSGNDGGQDILRDGKTVLLTKGEPGDAAVPQCQSVFVLGEGGGGDESLSIPPGRRQPVDQIRGSVAAENPIRRDVVIRRQPFPQGAAQGVRVPLRLRQGRLCRLPDGLRYSKRADVGGEVQGRSTVCLSKAGPVAAVVRHKLTPLMMSIRSAHSSVRQRTLAVYSIRFARRMSWGSASRRVSPMKGLSWICPK